MRSPASQRLTPASARPMPSSWTTLASTQPTPTRATVEHDGAGEQVQGRGHALAQPPPAHRQGGLAVVGARVERSAGRQGGHRSPSAVFIGTTYPASSQPRRRANYPFADTPRRRRPCLLSRFGGKSQAAPDGDCDGATEGSDCAECPYLAPGRRGRRPRARRRLRLRGFLDCRRTAGKGFELEDPPAPGTPDFARMVEALTARPAAPGQPRPPCSATAPRSSRPCWRRSARPERTVDFATYVYWTGSIAPEFAEALADRSKAGSRSTCCSTPWRGQDGPLPDRPAGGRRGQGGLVPADQLVHPAQAEQPHPPQDPGGRRPRWLHRRVGIAEEWTGKAPRTPAVLAQHPRAGRGPGPPRPVRRLPRQLGRGDPVHPVPGPTTCQTRRLRRRRPDPGRSGATSPRRSSTSSTCSMRPSPAPGSGSG